MKSLQDYFRANMHILSIGLNPSLISIDKEFYFANPRNRFWKALNDSNLVDEILIPSKEAQLILLEKYNIGCTDVVKRPSSMGKDLKNSDYREWSPVLLRNIRKYRPSICWFHGKIAIKNFLKYTGSSPDEIVWGQQSFLIEKSIVFVSPNPSPANAIYSLKHIKNWYNTLAKLNNKINN